MNLKEQLATLVKGMQAIVDGAKAQDRELNNAEIVALEAKDAEAKDLKARIERAEKGAAVLRAIGEAPGGSYTLDMGTGEYVSRLAGGAGVKAQAAAAWATKSAAAIRDTMARGVDGAKALISGSVGVPALIGDVVQIPTRPQTLLDLIAMPPAPPTGEGRGFSFIRQGTRTNNAAAVADGATKPTSVATFSEIDDTFRVYANLSEPFPIRYVEDHANLVDVLRVQLAENVLTAIENDIINGPGTGDAFLGIVGTSGIATSAYSTDLLTSLSNGRWAAINGLVDVTGWVLHPTDVKALEQLKDTTGRFMFNGPDEIASWLGAPFVINSALPAKTALVGDWRTVELLVREGARVDVDTAGTLFSSNQAVMRVEQRVGLKIGRPGALVKVGTAA